MDILLVAAVLKSDSYAQIPLLKSIYGQYFSNIIFCGSFDPPSDANYNLIVIPLKHGLLAYECLAAAARRFLRFKGYLLTKDDTFLNLWKIAELDRTRIWTDSANLGDQRMFSMLRDQWIWWSTPWGLPACENAYKDLVHLNELHKLQTREKVNNPLTWDVENSLNALLWNGRGSYHCFRSSTNVIYIPRTFSFVFERLSSVFYKHQVFMDIAVPTIVRMLQLEGKIVRLQGTDIGRIYGDERAQENLKYFWKHFDYNATYIRPVAFDNLGQDLTKRDILHSLTNELQRANNCDS